MSSAAGRGQSDGWIRVAKTLRLGEILNCAGGAKCSIFGPSIATFETVKFDMLIVANHCVKWTHLSACSPGIPSARWPQSPPRSRSCCLQGLRERPQWAIISLIGNLAAWRPTCRGHRRRLTFTAAAAAPKTPPDDQADGVSCGRGLALLCCRGNGVLGRWRKWTSILRWETVTTEVAVSEFRSCLASMTKRSPADSKGAK